MHDLSFGQIYCTGAGTSTILYLRWSGIWAGTIGAGRVHRGLCIDAPDIRRLGCCLHKHSRKVTVPAARDNDPKDGTNTLCISLAPDLLPGTKHWSLYALIARRHGPFQNAQSHSCSLQQS